MVRVRGSWFVVLKLADGGCDWNAGILACMSAKHEKGARARPENCEV
jgi:hypothetical protein